jgi:hypothetical protein
VIPGRMSKTSPTQRTLKHLRDLGCIAQVVERWNAFARKRVDLFSVVDVLAIAPDGTTIAVQATSGSNVSSRVQKIADAPETIFMRKAGWKLLVYGWRKNAAGKWTLREVDCS